MNLQPKTNCQKKFSFLCVLVLFLNVKNILGLGARRKFILLWWFSVGICKYEPGYKSHDQFNDLSALSG